jgi:hypothetical protein
MTINTGTGPVFTVPVGGNQLPNNRNWSKPAGALEMTLVVAPVLIACYFLFLVVGPLLVVPGLFGPVAVSGRWAQTPAASASKEVAPTFWLDRLFLAGKRGRPGSARPRAPEVNHRVGRSADGATARLLLM